MVNPLGVSSAPPQRYYHLDTDDCGLLIGPSLAVHVGSPPNMTTFHPPTRLLLYYSAILPDLVTLNPTTNTHLLQLPDQDPEAFAHLLSWLQNFYKEVSIVPSPTSFPPAAADLEYNCTLLARIYLMARYLNVTAIQQRILDELERTMQHARKEGYSTPVSPDVIFEVYDDVGAECALWEMLMVEMCSAFTGPRRPSYEYYEECFEIEEFNHHVMNAVAEEVNARLIGAEKKGTCGKGTDKCLSLKKRIHDEETALH